MLQMRKEAQRVKKLTKITMQEVAELDSDSYLLDSKVYALTYYAGRNTLHKVSCSFLMNCD